MDGERDDTRMPNAHIEFLKLDLWGEMVSTKPWSNGLKSFILLASMLSFVKASDGQHGLNSGYMWDALKVFSGP